MNDIPRLNQHPPLLVGRARELQALDQCLILARNGQGGIVLIGGEVGIGKTTLANQLLSRSSDQGVLGLAGQTDLLAQTPPYGPWLEVFSRAPKLASDIAPPLLAGPEIPSADVATLFARVKDYLVELSRVQPVILLLEDFHWADPASIDLLRFLSRDLSTVPVLILVTYRADELTRQHPLSLAIPTLVRQAGALRLDLRRLEPDDSRDLVSGRYSLPEDDTYRLLDYLEQRAEGNPLYIGEILRALEQEQILSLRGDGWALGDLGRLRVPSLLRQVIDERVMRIGEDTYDLLSIAAVIGPEVTFSLWSRVSDVPEDQLIDVVETAVDAHLLDAGPDGTSVSFSHALIRESLYEGILPPRRRQRHRKVADALLATSDPDPDSVAYHLQRSGDPRAADWLIRAGMRAQRSYALITAAQRFGLALEILETQGAPDSHRAELMYRIARMERYADPRHSLHYLDDALSLAEGENDPILTAYLRCFRGSLLCAVGDLSRGLVELETGLRGIDGLDHGQRQQLRDFQERLGEPADEYQFRGAYANWLAVIGRASDAIDQGRRMVQVEPVPGIGTSGYANAWRGLASAYALRGQPEQAQHACDRATSAYRTVDHPYQIGNARLLELFEVTIPYRTDQIAERTRLAEEAEQSWTRASGATVDLPPRFVWLPILLVEGNWDEAWQLAQSARTPTRRRGWRPFATTILAILAKETGDEDLAWELIHEQLPSGHAVKPGDGIYLDVVPLLRIAAELALRAGEGPAARAWLEAHDLWTTWSGAVLGRADGHLAWANYHRATGQPEQALQEAEQALSEARSPRQPLLMLAAHRLLGELKNETGQHDEATDQLESALALADDCRAEYERGLTLISLAGLQHIQKSDTSSATLAEARSIFQDIGASPALTRANALAITINKTSPQRHVAPLGLTNREFEILKLIAEGRTDRDIAETLYISPRTVTTHVTHILDKLDVPSRTAAAALAVREGIV